MQIFQLSPSRVGVELEVAYTEKEYLNIVTAAAVAAAKLTPNTKRAQESNKINGLFHSPLYDYTDYTFLAVASNKA